MCGQFKIDVNDDTANVNDDYGNVNVVWRNRRVKRSTVIDPSCGRMVEHMNFAINISSRWDELTPNLH